MDVIQHPLPEPFQNIILFIIIDLPAQIKKIPEPSTHLSNNSSSIAFVSHAPVRNLGVTFDPHLSLSNHISNHSRFCSCTFVTSAAFGFLMTQMCRCVHYSWQWEALS